MQINNYCHRWFLIKFQRVEENLVQKIFFQFYKTTLLNYFGLLKESPLTAENIFEYPKLTHNSRAKCTAKNAYYLDKALTCV